MFCSKLFASLISVWLREFQYSSKCCSLSSKTPSELYISNSASWTCPLFSLMVASILSTKLFTLSFTFLTSSSLTTPSRFKSCITRLKLCTSEVISLTASWKEVDILLLKSSYTSPSLTNSSLLLTSAPLRAKNALSSKDISSFASLTFLFIASWYSLYV